MTPEDLAKIEKYNKHKNAALQLHQKKIYNDTSYKLTSVLIPLNPDFYTLFNFRKEIVNELISKDASSKAKLLEAELSLMDSALLKNPKSYYAWHHRTWVLDQNTSDLKQELGLCSKLLQMDNRNFHGWNHRRFVANLAIQNKLIDVKSEFDYTTEKIKENFSNYSAWHYRSKLIRRMVQEKEQSMISSNSQQLTSQQANAESAEKLVATLNITDTNSLASSNHLKQESVDSCAQSGCLRPWYDNIIDSELDFVKKAFVVEPEDQSIWLYHRWLLGHIVLSSANVVPTITSDSSKYIYSSPICIANASGNRLADIVIDAKYSFFTKSAKENNDRLKYVLTRELDFMQKNMLVLEPDSKRVLLQIAILTSDLLECLKIDRVSKNQSTSETQSDIKKLENIFLRLVELDPMRKQHYLDSLENIVKSNIS
jgi:geranylgeranyl transferase type-2 subunit alpha